MKQTVDTIDIVIPVFRGFDQTIKCVSSVLASPCRTPFEVVVVDDAGPENALREWLHELASDGRITLLANEVNLGFVASVNRGMALHPERDVVLLNSDTEVAGDWLDRMARCAAATPLIASVTPFSNNATLASFPLPFEPNALPHGWSTERLDKVFATVNAGKHLKIPTAVGFCMLITRESLDAVGMFDEVAFGLGYGEENDFCRRAARHGWQNLLCGDVFIFHSGGVSFGSSATTRQLRALDVIRARFPDYEALIASFRAADPVKQLRDPVAEIVLRESLSESCDNRGAILHLLGVGGGAVRYVRNLCDAALASTSFQQHFLLFISDLAIAVLEDVRTGLRYPLQLGAAEGADRDLIGDAVRAMNIRTVHLHSLAPAALSLLRHFDALECRLIVTLHDIGFLSRTAFSSPMVSANDADDYAWRCELEAYLKNAVALLAPSDFIAQTFSNAFPALPRPHVSRPVEPSFEMLDTLPDKLAGDIEASITKAGLAQARYRVAVVGALGVHKGLDYWRQVREDTWRADPGGIGWVLIGYGDNILYPSAGENLIVHGVFEPCELAGLLRAYSIDLVYFPSGMPESHCFALSDVWLAGWPVVAHDLGALGERLTAHPEGGWLLPKGLTPRQTATTLAEILDDHQRVRHLTEETRISARNWLSSQRDTTLKIEELWMNDDNNETPDPLTITTFQQRIRPVVDDAFFRAELRKAIDDNAFLMQQNESLGKAVDELRSLAIERERWAEKLEKDIVDLQSLAAERERWAEKLEQDIAVLRAARVTPLRLIAILARKLSALVGRPKGR